MGLGTPKHPSPIEPAGRAKGPRFTALQLGAKALQATAPLNGFDAYLVGFHPAKDDPSMQMEAHHYCKVVNDDLIHTSGTDVKIAVTLGVAEPAPNWGRCQGVEATWGSPASSRANASVGVR
ncbi:OBAP family protein [Brachybacterium muris]|uniref:OBAP family protein n=1 Tax=Brachybacterium muris TaxID=219301 RepID=UPI00223B9E94